MKPCNLRLFDAETGITARPSRIEMTASVSTIPALLAACKTDWRRFDTCPSRERISRRTAARSGDAESRTLPNSSTMRAISRTICESDSTPSHNSFIRGYSPSCRLRTKSTVEATDESVEPRRTTSAVSRKVPSTRTLSTMSSMSKNSCVGASPSIVSMRRISSASD